MMKQFSFMLQTYFTRSDFTWNLTTLECCMALEKIKR